MTYKPLSECIEKIIDHRGKTPEKMGGAWVQSGIPAISAKNVKDGKLKDLSSLRFVSEETYKRWMKEDIKSGDCFLVSEGATLGERLYWNYDYPIVLSQRLFAIRANKKILDPKYLYAYMNSNEFQSEIIARSTGTSVPGIRQSELLKVKIFCPELSIQKIIGEFYYNIFKQIDINETTNSRLEELTEAIFHSWFVDFEPVLAKKIAIEAGLTHDQATSAAMASISGLCSPFDYVEEVEKWERCLKDRLSTLGKENAIKLKNTAELFPFEFEESELGLIPKGWSVSNINEASSLIIDHRGKTPSKMGGDWAQIGVPTISAKNVKNGRLISRATIRYVDQTVYKKWMRDELQRGDIIMTSEAPLGETMFLSDDTKYCLSQRLYAIRANKSQVTPTYLYYWLNCTSAKAEMEARSTGTTVTGIKQSELRKVKVLRPPLSVTEEFETLAAPALQLRLTNENKNLALSKLREILLPRLLAGNFKGQ